MAVSKATAALDGSPRIDREAPRPRMAKAKLPDLTICEERKEYGGILRRASEIAGMNRDQTADALKVDPAQVSRWWSGDDNPQTWRYRRHPVLRIAYLKAQAEKEPSSAVRVRTVIEVDELRIA